MLPALLKFIFSLSPPTPQILGPRPFQVSPDLKHFILPSPNGFTVTRPYVPILAQGRKKKKSSYILYKRSQKNSLLPLENTIITPCSPLAQSYTAGRMEVYPIFTIHEDTTYELEVQDNMYMT